MFDKLFNKNNKSAEQAQKPTMVFSGKPSKKKKNTYTIRLIGKFDLTLWSLCQNTPMPIIEINGVPTQNANGGCMKATNFPNPGATEMAEMAKYPEWREFAGKLHGTIVEYRDKNTNEPALLLFPNNRLLSLVPGIKTMDDVANVLNHASRRDLKHQMTKRDQVLAAFEPIHNRRMTAMKNAPRDQENRAQFVRELDKSQLEYVHKLMAQRQK